MVKALGFPPTHARLGPENEGGYIAFLAFLEKTLSDKCVGHRPAGLQSVLVELV
jgi:hypothetical protein